MWQAAEARAVRRPCCSSARPLILLLSNLFHVLHTDQRIIRIGRASVKRKPPSPKPASSMRSVLALLGLAMLGGASAQQGMRAPGPDEVMPGTAAILPGTSKVPLEGEQHAGEHAVAMCLKHQEGPMAL